MSLPVKRSRKSKAAVVKNGRLRLSVFKSNTNIYAQIVDDGIGKTVVSSSSLKLIGDMSLTDKARLVGSDLADKALKSQVKSVWFDRGAYKFTGRVKALADAARSNGLDF